MLHPVRNTLIAAAMTAMIAGSAMAQSDRYDRDRYRYDDYGSRQQYDTRYDNDRYDQRYGQSSQQRRDYADLFDTQRDPSNVYGYEAPYYTPPRDQDWRTPEQQRQQAATPYRGQTLTGQVREVETLRHGDVEHRHITLRTDAGQSVSLDLGPTSQLGGLNLERGDRVRIMGRYRSVNGGREEFMADRIQLPDEQRLLIDRELKYQWVTGNVIDQTRTGFTLRTDEGRRILVDLGPVAEQVNLSAGARIQALGTLAEFDGQPVLIATQLRSLHTTEFTRQQTQQQQRQVQEEDEDDEWENFGQSILEDIFR